MPGFRVLERWGIVVPTGSRITIDAELVLADIKGKIVYIDDQRPVVELFDPVIGETRHVASLGETPNLADGFTVFPDGNWMLYTQDDAATGRDIMLVENFDP